jgi:hypothetical protein
MIPDGKVGRGRGLFRLEQSFCIRGSFAFIQEETIFRRIGVIIVGAGEKLFLMLPSDKETRRYSWQKPYTSLFLIA